MKKSDDLFRLIKSMSKSEKRYFKLQAGVHTIGEKNVYVKLFDIIDKMDIYDEDSILKKYKGEKFTKNLFSAKNYLFNLILRILTVYNAESSIDIKLRTMLSELDILFEKGLYKQFKSVLARAEKMARENEKYYYLAILLERKAVYILTQVYGEKGRYDIDSLGMEILEVLEKIKYSFEYKLLYEKLFFLIKETEYDVLRGEKTRLENFIKNPLLVDDSNAVSASSKFFYYSILAFYNLHTGNYEKSYEYRKILNNILEKIPNIMNLYPRNYLSNVINLASVCSRMKNYDEMHFYISKLRQILNMKFENEKSFKDIRSKVIVSLADMELASYISSCRFEGIENDIRRIVSDTEKYTLDYEDSRKIIIYNSAAYLYFINKNYTKALELVNKTLNYSNTAPEQKIHIVARIFGLIIHFEMENYELLEYTLNNTKIYFKKSNRLYSFEKCIFDFMKKSLGIADNNKMNDLFKKLKYDLGKIHANAEQDNPLELFDIMSWIESKINRKEFKDILKEKAGIKIISTY